MSLWAVFSNEADAGQLNCAIRPACSTVHINPCPSLPPLFARFACLRVQLAAAALKITERFC